MEAQTLNEPVLPLPTILVADDDWSAREILTMRLLKWGYTVMSAKNGHEALSILLEKDGPAVALLDWEMPTINGLEVCRKLRQFRPSGRPVPYYRYVIMVSARDTRADLLAGLAAGADD